MNPLNKTSEEILDTTTPTDLNTASHPELVEYLANLVTSARKASELHNDLRYVVRHNQIDAAVSELERRTLETTYGPTAVTFSA